VKYGREQAKGLCFILAPYRVCLLGARVDHQDGLVSGMALDHFVARRSPSAETTTVVGLR
jgi:hypothetical protein